MNELQDYLDEALKNCNIMKAQKENNIYNELAKELISLRNEKGITQKQLAELCRVQQSNISRMENGNYNPSVQLLVRIAAALGKEVKIEFV
jgi:DNA-binding XRE family transcriptional regulator